MLACVKFAHVERLCAAEEISKEEERYRSSAPSSPMLWAGLDSCCSLLCRENVKLLLTLIGLPQQHLDG